MRTSKIDVIEKDKGMANLKDIVHITAIYKTKILGVAIYDMYATLIIKQILLFSKWLDLISNKFRHKYGKKKFGSQIAWSLTQRNNTIPPKLLKNSCTSCALFYANVS